MTYKQLEKFNILLSEKNEQLYRRIQTITKENHELKEENQILNNKLSETKNKLYQITDILNEELPF